jgi:hypothetical protein
MLEELFSEFREFRRRWQYFQTKNQNLFQQLQQ